MLIFVHISNYVYFIQIYDRILNKWDFTSFQVMLFNIYLPHFYSQHFVSISALTILSCLYETDNNEPQWVRIGHCWWPYQPSLRVKVDRFRCFDAHCDQSIEWPPAAGPHSGFYNLRQGRRSWFVVVCSFVCPAVRRITHKILHRFESHFQERSEMV